MTRPPWRLLRLARAIAERAGAYEPLLHAVINESHLLEGMGEHERAAEVARAGIARAEELRPRPVAGTFLAINVAEPLVSLGRWDEATEVIEHALALSPPRRPSGPTLRQLAGEIALRRGDLADAGESMAAAARAALGAASCGHEGPYSRPVLHTAGPAGPRAAAGRRQAGRRAGRRGRGRPAATWPLTPGTRGRCWPPPPARSPRSRRPAAATVRGRPGRGPARPAGDARRAMPAARPGSARRTA